MRNTSCSWKARRDTATMNALQKLFQSEREFVGYKPGVGG
jgi:hypothetical protein